MMQTHRLKTIARYWDSVDRGEKTFEVRKNDRAFQTGDVLELVKIDDKGFYVNPPGGNRFDLWIVRRRITYILQGGQFGIEPQYCVMGLGLADGLAAAGREGG